MLIDPISTASAHVVRTACSGLDCGSSDKSNHIAISGNFTFQRELKSYQLYTRCSLPFRKKKKKVQNVPTALMCRLIHTKPRALRPLSSADWRGFSPSLKSNNEGKIKKVEYLSIAAAHVLSSFVARQRHTGLELARGVWHRKMRVGNVTGFQSETDR